jgi:hypothetical protein
MAIGRLLRKEKARVRVGYKPLHTQGSCNSACVLVLAGATGRDMEDGKVGIHRPYFDVPAGEISPDKIARVSICRRSPAGLILEITVASAWPFGHDETGTRCVHRKTTGLESDDRSMPKKTRFRLQPFADDAGALLAVLRPGFRKDVVGDVLGFDAECTSSGSSS